MSGAGVMRIKKLKGNGIITVAARHNKREIQAELGATGSIDPTRSHLNYAIAGPPAAADVGQLAKDLMTAAGVVKLKKGAVMALEVVFSLPPAAAIDDRACFTASAEWAVSKMGGVILSVDVHLDEAAPHCHVLLLPLVNGKMNGSDMVGGRQKLMALQKDFHAAVASKFGLSKAPARLAGPAKQAGAKAVLQHLRDTADPVLRSLGWPAYRDAIEAAPEPFLLAYGLELATSKKKLRTFTQIMTSKGKGPAKEPNHIGKVPPEKDLSICSVGQAPNPPLPAAPPLPARPAPVRPPPAARPPAIDLRQPQIEDGLEDRHHLLDTEGGEEERVGLDEVRDRDENHDPALYDPDTGEFFKRPPTPARRQQQAARAWVATAFAATARH